MASQIEEVHQRFGVQDFFSLVRSVGKKVSHARCQCPLEGCQDNGANARLNAAVTWYAPEKKFSLYCHSCKKSADYLDLYQRVKGVDLQTAIRECLGSRPEFKPNLRLVTAQGPDMDGKLKPSEVATVWGGLAAEDDIGRAYLESRRLAEAIQWCRFATHDYSDKALSRSEIHGKSEAGFRVAMLLSDLTGQPMGIQFRSVRVTEKEKQRMLTRSTVKQSFFGNPGGIVSADTVVVCEGMADTLAACLWVPSNETRTVVVGAPGCGALPGLSEALEVHGIDVTGRTFVLLSQMDRGPKGNKSLREFTKLKSMLVAKGAEVLLLTEPPGEVKDWADSHKAGALPAWPPRQLALMREAEAEEKKETQARVGAVWQSKEPMEPDTLGKNLQTLQWLLWADSHRVAICGPGKFELNEMTGLVEYGRKPLQENDYTAIRVAIENYKGGMDNKVLKFDMDAVRQTAAMLAQLNAYHPVRTWLNELQWDGVARLHELPGQILGLNAETQGLECEYVRRWMIAAVARALQPGCKVDTVLVLQGAQGIRKSTFFKVLGGEYTVTLSSEFGSPASIETLRRGWVVELDELDAVKRVREASTVTAFLTRSEDIYNAKWVREAQAVKRSSIFGGTTNDSYFLSDTTGSRRFWVIPVRKKIDTEKLREFRDQLFAEAVSEFKAGQPWFLEEELEVLREEKNSEYRSKHAWEEYISEGLRNHQGTVTTSWVLTEILKKLPGQCTAYDSQVVANILRLLGYRASRKQVDGQKIRIFEKPSPWEVENS